MTTTGMAVSAEHVDVRGRRVWLARSGHGEPLVYLHGPGELDGWAPALTLLARDFTVYRPDHPGFGRSDDDPSVDSVLDMAFSYLDLLDRLGLDRPALVGHSLGGWLAAQIAVLAPGRVRGLVLAGAAGLRAGVPAPDIFTLNPVQDAELANHRHGARAAAVAAAERITEDQELFQRYLRNRMATAHVGWNPYLHDPKLAGRLHRITAGVLIIWGAEDRLLPVGYAHRWAEALPAARLEIIEDAGHRPQAERPEAFAALVREFLA
ncbi:MAG: alpha/beta hydrolase [Streptosporangiaceae bacterium]|nr:alpha/beta hydrolase [Streptosporangiaceae bacterium]MBV9858211.1 alpha/beta hydrolase [Streptosporangiaceae bacterium]